MHTTLYNGTRLENIQRPSRKTSASEVTTVWHYINSIIIITARRRYA